MSKDNKGNKSNKVNQPTSMESAFQSAVKSLSKKKQTEIIADYVYSKYDVFRKFKPLALGIDEDLLKELSPQYEPELVVRFLAIHCRKPRYIKNLSRGGKRFNLKGSFKGEVTEQEQQHALNHPFVKQANENNTKPSVNTDTNNIKLNEVEKSQQTQESQELDHVKYCFMNEFL
ncbi:MAG: ProQ/FINO family protein [Neisseriaceae bacterium]|nr:osmoprotectant transport activator ProQ [Neisseriaceae bacterium PsAf]MCV2503255.1 ProQ/FINO family protein [Neisseriaceae bacterium]MCV2509140.1 ProQ/FINO family protein [Neisseriaceae bacterium]